MSVVRTHRTLRVTGRCVGVRKRWGGVGECASADSQPQLLGRDISESSVRVALSFFLSLPPLLSRCVGSRGELLLPRLPATERMRPIDRRREERRRLQRLRVTVLLPSFCSSRQPVSQELQHQVARGRDAHARHRLQFARETSTPVDEVQHLFCQRITESRSWSERERERGRRDARVSGDSEPGVKCRVSDERGSG